jgi:hypothetical protein
LLRLFKRGIKSKTGLGYSAINTARSALSTIVYVDGKPVGQHPLVCRFLKAVFHERPALPRYGSVWDVNKVLTYLRTLSPVRNLVLKDLTKKLVMLMGLLSAQRGQTLHLLNVRDMELSFSKAKFTVNELVKQTRPGTHVADLVFTGYAPDRRLCVLTVLKEYLKRTLYLRGAETRLFISTVKPHKRVSSQTISRWIKAVLAASGVDTTIFRSHSTRAAAVSAAVQGQVPVQVILKAAGWSRESTFAKYYNKPLSQEGVFANTLLDRFKSKV